MARLRPPRLRLVSGGGTRRRPRKRPRGAPVLVACLVAAGLVALLFPAAFEDAVNAAVGIDSTASGRAISGRATVVDGDTITIGTTRIRLHGIDAPEARQTCRLGDQQVGCGRWATDALRGRIGGRTVSCMRRDTDRYGRIVAVCLAGEEDINGWMVSQGWAVAYRRYAADYVWAEWTAWFAGHGIWRTSFEAPWEWRAARRR